MKQSKTNKDLSLLHKSPCSASLLAARCSASCSCKLKSNCGFAGLLPAAGRPSAPLRPPPASPAPWPVLQATPPLPLPARTRGHAVRPLPLLAPHFPVGRRQRLKQKHASGESRRSLKVRWGIGFFFWAFILGPGLVDLTLWAK